MLKTFFKNIFWMLPIKYSFKVYLRKIYVKGKFAKETKKQTAVAISDIVNDKKILEDYVFEQISGSRLRSTYYKDYSKHEKIESEFTIAAYYLTQYHPNERNNNWWGVGTTEWNNVNQATPQYIGHYQPRRPGELGYYDLRVKDNLYRQIELAKNYGVSVFCFYYYWFNGQRLLEIPLNMFLKEKNMKIDFFYCWANENWTKRFSGSDNEILMGMDSDVQGYKKFITDIIDDFKDERYFKISNRPVLSIYRPSLIPQLDEVISFWKGYVYDILGLELYLIAVKETLYDYDWLSAGFDSETDFQPRCIRKKCKALKVKNVHQKFNGSVFDYKDLVENKRYYYKDLNNRKIFPASMPMWDNTARRNFNGTIFHGSTPFLYEKWMIDLLKIVKENDELDEKMVFLNAWNEWGEGAYLEPDYYYGYAYLESLYNALKLYE